MDTAGESDSQSRRGWAARLLPLAVLLAVAALVYALGLHNYLTLEQLAENRDALKAFISGNFLLALAIFAGVYIAVVALSLPGGALMTVSGGFLFGLLVGGLASVIAATIGATIIFLVAKTSLGEPLAARAGPWLGKLRAGFQENALNYLLFLRLVPLFPFWLVNLAPALLGVPLATYLLGTFAGIIPGTFAFAFAGVGLDSVIEAQQRSYETCLAEHAGGGASPCEFALDPSALVTPQLLIAFAALGAVALIPVILKKFRKEAPTA
jgi:uncharacterized membrane protein YdjX (TVP38/TMEM64 family)